MLNAGFIIWHLLWQRSHRSGFQVGQAFDSSSTGDMTRYIQFIAKAVAACALSALVAMPFLLQQAFAYRAFCTQAAARPWCMQSLPLVYAFAQAEYW